MSTPDEDLLVVELFQVAVDFVQLPLVDPLGALLEPPDSPLDVIAAPPELCGLDGVPVTVVAPDPVPAGVVEPPEEVDDPVVDELEPGVPEGLEALGGPDGVVTPVLESPEPAGEDDGEALLDWPSPADWAFKPPLVGEPGEDREGAIVAGAWDGS